MVDHASFDGAIERALGDGIVVVEHDGPGDLAAWVRTAARAQAAHAVLVVVPADRAVLQTELAADVHERLEHLGVLAVRDRVGETVIGLAGALVEVVSLDDIDVDERELLVHRYEPDAGTAVVLAGRVVNTATDDEPVVVVADDGDALAAALADDGSRDLVRILRYDDAVDDDDTWRVAADEVLDVPFWTPAFCATVIRAAEAVGAFAPNEDDPVPGHEVSLATISPKLFAMVEAHVGATVMAFVHERWPYVDYHGLRDAFVIKYAMGAQTELRMHHDVAQLSGSVRLNAGYDGCRLQFPRQDYDNGDVAVGRLLVWPSMVTHPHRATPLTRGVKYSLTLWFELPPGSVDDHRA